MFDRVQIRIQHAFLSLIRRTKINAPYIPLFYPQANLYYKCILPSWIYKEIFICNQYIPPIHLPDGARILDLGANIGIASLFFLNHLPSCQLTAVEPNPVSFACLERTVNSIHSPNKIERINAAVSNGNGITTLYVPKGIPTALNASITGRDVNVKSASLYKVQLLHWKNLCKEPIHFMKIDVEGSEYNILSDLDFTSDCIGSFIVEFHDVELHKEELPTILQKLRSGFISVNNERREVTANDYALSAGSVIIRFYAKKLWWS
jgi:FkbM family methyltransferase